jgi:DNA processing protein
VSTTIPVANNAAVEQSLQWLALGLTPGLGPTRARRLVEHFGNVGAIFRASLTELEATGLLVVSAQALGTGKSLERAQGRIGESEDRRRDDCYVRRFCLSRSPKADLGSAAGLYVRGEVSVLSEPGIAVVGTRHPTPYGSGMAERLAIDLSARGLVILSGMARAVDTAAHRGTIAAKGKAVAVFGTGVDVLYPKENTRLADQILALGGALISEFPLGTFTAPQNFPIRNQIVSGMSIGVLVVEAAESAAHASPRVARLSKIGRCLRCRAM